MELAYDGAGFKGWQRLPGAQRTVQETVETALSGVLGFPVTVTGAGRTDAGVHAEAQAANFHARTDAPLAELGERINAALPRDLACVSLREAVPSFHARYRAVAKTYAYRLADGPGAAEDADARRVSLAVRERLDEGELRAAARAFLGRRSFRAFTNAKHDELDFIRTVASADAVRDGAFIDLVFTADGFLYNQARLMAAAVLATAAGRLYRGAIGALLKSGDRAKAPGALGAFGLRLVSVSYREEDFSGEAARTCPQPSSGASGVSVRLPFRLRD